MHEHRPSSLRGYIYLSVDRRRYIRACASIRMRCAYRDGVTLLNGPHLFISLSYCLASSPKTRRVRVGIIFQFARPAPLRFYLPLLEIVGVARPSLAPPAKDRRGQAAERDRDGGRREGRSVPSRVTFRTRGQEPSAVSSLSRAITFRPRTRIGARGILKFPPR